MTEQPTSDPTRAETGADAAVDAPSAAVTSAEDGADIITGDEALRREVEDTRERMLRVAAEFDNFRKRAVKERQEAGWRAQGDLVRGLLDALDDLQRFASVDPATVDARTVVDGIALVEKKIVKSLAGHGFEIVNPIDHPFDPNLHEALGTAPAGAAEEDGLVATVYQVGYVINGHLLRPARVVVKQWNGGAA
jgi:molecular chaperone GrpE